MILIIKSNTHPNHRKNSVEFESVIVHFKSVPRIESYIYKDHHLQDYTHNLLPAAANSDEILLPPHLEGP